MISWPEKLLFGLALVPAILEGQEYVERMDKMSISEWLKDRGAPPAIEREIFIAMTKALAFVDPDKVSATVVLTALNRFLQAGAQFTCLAGTKVQILTPEAVHFSSYNRRPLGIYIYIYIYIP